MGPMIKTKDIQVLGIYIYYIWLGMISDSHLSVKYVSCGINVFMSFTHLHKGLLGQVTATLHQWLRCRQRRIVVLVQHHVSKATFQFGGLYFI